MARNPNVSNPFAASLGPWTVGQYCTEPLLKGQSKEVQMVDAVKCRERKLWTPALDEKGAVCQEVKDEGVRNQKGPQIQ